MSKKKNDNQLVRFVWSRNIDYDFLLLLEVQERNPFSFKKPKPAWEEIAKSLRNGELEMKVTDRSCRERVAELLKKHRKEEGAIIRSTGATDDKITELKNLLIAINEMSLAKPNEADSNVFKKANKRKAETLRNAALNEISDTDSDDYIQNSHTTSRTRSDEEVRDVRDLLHDDDMTLEEEALMDNESIARAESLESWKDIPGTSRDNSHSVAEAHLQSNDVDDVDLGSLSNYNVSNSLLSISTVPTPNNKPTPTSNNRFSNPKKDLINYLQNKSQNELGLRKEEIDIRKMEVQLKKEELDILRIKTESEAMEKRRSLEIEAESKKEELGILRLKTEAEIEERKKTQELLIALLTKKD